MISCSSKRSAFISLSLAFFRLENIKILQNGIRKGVYDRSNDQYIIDQQNCDELKIIMRSIYLQNAKNQPNNIKEQIEELNQLVLDYAINQIYNEAISYIKYKQDASTLHVLPNHPTNSSTKGKTEEFKRFF